MYAPRTCFSTNQPHQVRTSAWRVWKSIINATPRVVRELLPTLMDLIIDALASEHIEQQTAAGHTLGELVSKMSEAVLPVRCRLFVTFFLRNLLYLMIQVSDSNDTK